jgi:hypothetical protein
MPGWKMKTSCGCLLRSCCSVSLGTIMQLLDVYEDELCYDMVSFPALHNGLQKQSNKIIGSRTPRFAVASFVLEDCPTRYKRHDRLNVTLSASELLTCQPWNVNLSPRPPHWLDSRRHIAIISSTTYAPSLSLAVRSGQVRSGANIPDTCLCDGRDWSSGQEEQILGTGGSVGGLSPIHSAGIPSGPVSSGIPSQNINTVACTSS